MRSVIIDYLQSGLLGFLGMACFMGACAVARRLIDRWMPPRRPRG